MNKVLAIALITLKEGLKQRIFYALGIIAVVLLFSGVMVAGFFMRDISKILVDIALSLTAFGGLLVPVFIAVNMLAGDIDRRTIFTIMAHPVERWQYVAGKFLGLSWLTLLVVLFLAGAGLVAVWAGYHLYGPVYFSKFNIFAYLIAVFLICIGLNVLLALSLFWCSISTSSFLALMLTLASYFIGHTLDDIVAFVNTNAPKNSTEELIREVINTVQYLFPNLSAFDAKLAAAHGIVMPAGEILMLTLYGVAYLSALLVLSALIYSRRDIQ